ncbi:MAG: UDP-glucose 4-epimerase GalE [Mycoplasmatales bacterium]
MSKKILIVGGAGYIGSHQVKVMCDLGYSITVLDNLNTGFKQAVDKRAKLIIGDLREKELVKKILIDEEIEGVIHFAALSLVGESVNKPLEYYNNNVYGMQILLEAMRETKVLNIVFSSTAAVYGEHEIMPITEEYSKNPTSPYGETKLAMEKMIKWASDVSDLNYISLRYFNVAGASDDASIGEAHNPETHLVPLVIRAAINDTSIKVFGDDYPTADGTCIRDYIHVLDLVNAHILAIEYLSENKQSHALNLGYGHGFSVKEIITRVEKVVGKEIKKELVERRAGDPAMLVADNQKAISVLKWVPEYDDIEKIVSSAYAWHKNQQY